MFWILLLSSVHLSCGFCRGEESFESRCKGEESLESRWDSGMAGKEMVEKEESCNESGDMTNILIVTPISRSHFLFLYQVKLPDQLISRVTHIYGKSNA